MLPLSVLRPSTRYQHWHLSSRFCINLTFVAIAALLNITEAASFDHCARQCPHSGIPGTGGLSTSILSLLGIHLPIFLAFFIRSLSSISHLIASFKHFHVLLFISCHICFFMFLNSQFNITESGKTGSKGMTIDVYFT